MGGGWGAPADVKPPPPPASSLIFAKIAGGAFCHMSIMGPSLSGSCFTDMTTV
jgi:hypothetical protein